MDIRNPIAAAYPEVQRVTLIARLAGLAAWFVGLCIFAAAVASREPWLFAAFVAWYFVLAVLTVVIAAAPRRRQALLDQEWARRFHELAIHDDLTGLYNRRYFNSELEAQIVACREVRAPLTIALIDLDDFKSINDSFGHAAGDMALRVAGEALLAAAPAGATVARTGGDEFAVIMPAVSIDQGEHVAAAIRRRLEAASFAIHGAVAGPGRIRAAIGLATLGATATPDQLLHEADTELYAHKGAFLRAS